MKGFVQVRKCKAKKVDGVWVPDGEFTPVVSGSNDFTVLPTYHQFHGEIALVYSGPMPRNTTANIMVHLKPFHKGTHVAGFGNSEANSNAEIVKKQSSRVAWHVLTDNQIDPPYYLYHSRFDPSGSERTIWGASMHLESGNTAINNGGGATIASLPFASGCVQASDELLDVLYRIEPNVTGLMNGRGNSQQYAENLLGLATAATNMNAWVGIPTYLRTTPINVADDTPAHITESGVAHNHIQMLLDSTPDRNLNTGVTILSAAEVLPGASIGTYIGGMMLSTALASGNTYNYSKFLQAGQSAIQNIYTRADASSPPYSDSANAALGLGQLTANDAGWAPPDNILSSLFRIHMTAGGAVGVSTYKIFRKPYQATEGNEWWCLGIPLAHLPTAYADTLADNYYAPNAPSLGPLDVPGCGLDPAVLSVSNNNNANESVSHYRIVVRYNYPEWISADLSRIAIHDLSSNYEIVDNSHTFPLLATEITQIVSNSTGDIFIACRNTGLYKISRTFQGAITAIAKIDIVAAVDDEKCFGVQMGDSDSIWALIGQEMCHSVDGGANWTIYNEASDPQFTITGHTSGANDFSFTAGIFRRDIQDPNINQFYIPVPTVLYGQDGTWWSLEGSSPSSDEVAMTNHASRDAGSMPLVAMMKHKFSSKGKLVTVSKSMTGVTQAYWAFGTAGNTYNSASGTTSGPTVGAAINIFTNDSGVEFVMGGSNSTSPGYATVLRNLDTVEVGGSTFSHALLGEDNHNPYLFGATTSNIAYGNQPAVYIGGGVLIYLAAGCTGNSVGQLHEEVFSTSITTTSMMAVPVGGDLFDTFRNEFWEAYGWDGGNWVLDEAGSKTTHVANEAVMYGVEVGFEDTSSSASDYLLDEYYDLWVYDGIIKDDSTSIDFDGTPILQLPSLKSNTYSVSTVPASDEVWVDRPIKLFNRATPTRTGTTQAMSLNTSQNRKFGLMHQHELTGDFTLKFKYSDLVAITESALWNAGNVTDTDGGYIGLFPLANMSLVTYGGVVDPSDMILGVRLWHSQLDDGGAEKKCALVYNGVIQGTFVTTTGVGIDDEWTLERIGTDVTLDLNAVNVITDSGAPTTAAVVGGAAIANYYFSSKQQDRTQCTVFTDITLSTTFTGRRYIHMGAPASGHGLLEDPKFLGVTLELNINMTLQLDLVDVVYITDPTQAPAAGEVTLLLDGTMWFNTADAGKTLTGDWIYTKRLI